MATSAFQDSARRRGQLYRAVAGGCVSDVDRLLQNVADPDYAIHGRSLLHHAGLRGFNAIAWLLIQHGANPDRTYGQQNRSLLHFAAATGRYGFANELLLGEANPNAITTSGATPLHFVARTGQEYFTRLLLKNGANPLIRDSNGRTPFHLAAKNQFTAIAKLLSDSGGSELSYERQQEIWDEKQVPTPLPN
jgi:hypothetical protein